jgi:hypothetical protein
MEDFDFNYSSACIVTGFGLYDWVHFLVGVILLFVTKFRPVTSQWIFEGYRLSLGVKRPECEVTIQMNLIIR